MAERCKARTSVTWTSTGKRMSWKIGSRVSRSIDHSRSALLRIRMLEFYYDFLDQYFDRLDFELIQMDMESNYIAISADRH